MQILNDEDKPKIKSKKQNKSRVATPNRPPDGIEAFRRRATTLTLALKMTTRRHKRSDERERARALEFAESVWYKLKHTFPNAKSWVIFSSVAAQHEVGVGNESERLRRLEAAIEHFLASPDSIPEATEDILVIDSSSGFILELAEFIIRQKMMLGPLNYGLSGDDPLPEASIGYESYWTE